MKRVSPEVAKAIKEAGYSQDSIDHNIYVSEPNAPFTEVAYQPTYIEVWLWLWREKKNCIDIFSAHNHDALTYIGCELKGFLDPEEAIEEAIEYLVTNKLIK